MTSSITIRRQQVQCHIGVTEEEQAAAQTLEISVSFPIPDCAQLAVKDDVSRSVNYYDVYQMINAVAVSRPRHLIETLASDVADRLLREYHLPSIDIEVRKYILPDTEAVILNYSKAGIGSGKISS